MNYQLKHVNKNKRFENEKTQYFTFLISARIEKYIQSILGLEFEIIET